MAARARQWGQLRSGLATALGCLETGQVLILESRGDSRYVQFAAGGPEGMRVEAVSNRFLEGWQRLDRTAEARLRRLGWRPPTDLGEGPLNWWRSFEAPVPAAEVADLAVETFVKAFDVPATAELGYRAFSKTGAEILLPFLGVERTVEEEETDEPLASRVDAAMRGWLGVEEINRDADGDIPVRCGEAVIYVRATDQPELISVFCPVVFDVKRSAGLFEAVNDANASVRFARLAVTGPGVMASAEVDAGEGLTSSLARACDAVSWVANEWGSKLVDRFGGRTFFAEQDGSTPDEEIHGVYL